MHHRRPEPVLTRLETDGSTLFCSRYVNYAAVVLKQQGPAQRKEHCVQLAGQRCPVYRVQQREGGKMTERVCICSDSPIVRNVENGLPSALIVSTPGSLPIPEHDKWNHLRLLMDTPISRTPQLHMSFPCTKGYKDIKSKL